MASFGACLVQLIFNNHGTLLSWNILISVICQSSSLSSFYVVRKGWNMRKWCWQSLTTMSNRLTRITTTILLSFQHYNYFSPLSKRRKGNKNLCIITNPSGHCAKKCTLPLQVNIQYQYQSSLWSPYYMCSPKERSLWSRDTSKFQISHCSHTQHVSDTNTPWTCLDACHTRHFYYFFSTDTLETHYGHVCPSFEHACSWPCLCPSVLLR